MQDRSAPKREVGGKKNCTSTRLVSQARASAAFCLSLCASAQARVGLPWAAALVRRVAHTIVRLPTMHATVIMKPACPPCPSLAADKKTAAGPLADEPSPMDHHGHSIMHCKAPVWVKPNLGEAQLGHQASAEYKLRLYLGL